MENSCSTHGKLILFTLIHGFVILGTSTRLGPSTIPSSTTTFGNETDHLALLDLKKRITKDPLAIMSSWNDSMDFCSWVGVTCNHSTKRVMVLDLEDQQLAGSLPPSIGNLTHLTVINLRNNSFHSEIPQEMGRLRSLQHLNLSHNSFGGKIPTNISHCTQLKVLSLHNNKLIGSIPNQLSSLVNLNQLDVDHNNLTGTIPAWIGNFSSLYNLYLYENNFQGSIPNELGHLSLQEFIVSLNNLSGIVPPSIYNISTMIHFSVSQNQLHGELPKNVGITLPNVEFFSRALNKFTGNIPVSLSNASKLQVLEFSHNYLTGTVPSENLGSWQSLVRLNLAGNRLGHMKNGDLNFISFLANCTSLENLGLDDNQFGGELPGSIANLSTKLKYLFLGSNLIHGSIPIGFRNLVNLISLGMQSNFLGGSLPDEIGKLQKLQGLYLNNNTFSGPIPFTLGNLTSLTELFMEENRFTGSIPPSLGNFQNLQTLNLSSNHLTGTIPKELLGLSSLSISLSMSKNSLTGSLPSEVGDLINIGELDVSENELSGEIPTTLGSCTSLVRLHLEGNGFNGTIPQSLINIRNVEEIDVSRNNLFGMVPEFLGKLRFLMLLNLSHNDFEGELPGEGIFLNASGISIVGNDRLCGGILEFGLHACSSKKPPSFRGLLAPKVVIPVACAVAFIIALSCFIAIRPVVTKSWGKLVTSRSYWEWKSGISYLELVESTNGFSVENLIGSGSFGNVYKGVLPRDRKLVAIKVLNLQQPGASRSFINECKALRSTRHRNLLKIITVCSSIDNQGHDFKSLVFEFMTNGSLDSLLHPNDDDQSQNKRLSLIQRLNIAIDVASALDYLHHRCERTIVHCDLKPSNVLLSEDMVAHVGDFGLAKFLLEASDNPSQSQTISAGLRGSIGYIPPEYGMGDQISILGDIYSYGILLLEMFTGKRPTDDMFIDGLSIHQFAARAMSNHVMDIVDPSLIVERDDADADNDSYDNEIQERPLTIYQDGGPVQARRLEECLVSVIQIGLSCSATSPTERMLMEVVVNKLKATRDSYLNSGRRS